MKLIFMGTPEFSVPALEALINDGHEIVAVYTQPPRPAGRGQKERRSAVHDAAIKFNIEVRTPKTLKDEEQQQIFAQTEADMAIVVAYGLILPKAILDAKTCVNIHASLLPRWRGAAPIQRAILAGDKQTGVTIMQMDVGLDTGDMLIWESISIDDDINAGQLHDNLSVLGSKLIVDYVNKSAEITPVKQEGEVTYAEKISKEESLINCNESVSTVRAKIRAFSPFPGASFTYNNEKFKVYEANFVKQENKNKSGVIIDDKFGISLPDGVLYPIKIQRQGKKSMSVDELLRGFKPNIGDKVN